MGASLYSILYAPLMTLFSELGVLSTLEKFDQDADVAIDVEEHHDVPVAQL